MPSVHFCRRQVCLICTVLAALLVVALLPAAAADLKTAADQFAAGKRAYDREDYGRAYEEWMSAAEAGSHDAQFWIGELYRQGKGVGQNFDTAHAFYLRAALQGHPQAQFEAGEYLQHEKELGKDQQTISFGLLLRAAINGETYAYMSLAWAYCGGIGTEKNIVLSDAWKTLALENRHELGLQEGMQCEVWNPITESYRQEVLKRANALKIAYDLKPPYPPHEQ